MTDQNDQIIAAVVQLATVWLAERGGFYAIPEAALHTDGTVQVRTDNSGIVHFKLVR